MGSVPPYPTFIPPGPKKLFCHPSLFRFIKSLLRMCVHVYATGFRRPEGIREELKKLGSSKFGYFYLFLEILKEKTRRHFYYIFLFGHCGFFEHI